MLSFYMSFLLRSPDIQLFKNWMVSALQALTPTLTACLRPLLKQNGAHLGWAVGSAWNENIPPECLTYLVSFLTSPSAISLEWSTWTICRFHIRNLNLFPQKPSLITQTIFERSTTLKPEKSKNSDSMSLYLS